MAEFYSVPPLMSSGFHPDLKCHTFGIKSQSFMFFFSPFSTIDPLSGLLSWQPTVLHSAVAGPQAPEDIFEKKEV